MRYAAAFFVDQLNSVPSTHIRCRMTASLRATATLALRSPLRLASLTPHAFSVDHFGTRVSSTLAASNRYMRSMASPHFEIRPDQSTSPEACGGSSGASRDGYASQIPPSYLTGAALWRSLTDNFSGGITRIFFGMWRGGRYTALNP